VQGLFGVLGDKDGKKLLESIQKSGFGCIKDGKGLRSINLTF